MEQATLRSRVSIDAKRVVVFPGEVQPSGLTSDVSRPIRLTLSSFRFILRRVPRIGDASSCGVEWNTWIIALRWSDHAPAPIFGNQGDPVARQVNGRRRLCSDCRGSRTAASAALSE